MGQMISFESYRQTVRELHLRPVIVMRFLEKLLMRGHISTEQHERLWKKLMPPRPQQPSR
jgi:hypothetical protein